MHDTHHWFIKVIRSHRKPELVQNERHECSVTHVSCNLVRHVHVLQPWYTLYWPQPSHRTEATTRCAEQVVQQPVVPCVRVHEPAGNGTSRVTPCTLGSGERGAEDKDVLHNAKRLGLGKFH